VPRRIGRKSSSFCIGPGLLDAPWFRKRPRAWRVVAIFVLTALAGGSSHGGGALGASRRDRGLEPGSQPAMRGMRGPKRSCCSHFCGARDTRRFSPAAMAGYAALAVAASCWAVYRWPGCSAGRPIVLRFRRLRGPQLDGGGRPRRRPARQELPSAVAVLVLVGSTPLPKLLRGLESWERPRLLTLVVQFLYRYLFVVSEQAPTHAAGGAVARLEPATARIPGGGGAVAVLFARSYGRAEGIHQAYAGAGFSGHIRLLGHASRCARRVVLAAGVSLVVALRCRWGPWIP